MQRAGSRRQPKSRFFFHPDLSPPEGCIRRFFEWVKRWVNQWVHQTRHTLSSPPSPVCIDDSAVLHVKNTSRSHLDKRWMSALVC